MPFSSLLKEVEAMPCRITLRLDLLTLSRPTAFTKLSTLFLPEVEDRHGNSRSCIIYRNSSCSPNQGRLARQSLFLVSGKKKIARSLLLR